MDEKKRKWRFKGLKINDKYRLEIHNDTSYELIFHSRLNGRSVVVVLAISVFVLISLTTILIAFTPIREFIPGYPTLETRRVMQNNIQRIDSMENVIAEWYLYVDNYMKILSGNIPKIVQSNLPDSVSKSHSFIDVKSLQDSAFRSRIEREELINLTANTNTKNPEFLDMYFFAPLKGTVISKFDMSENHFGIDIVTVPNDVVMAVSDGTVIMADWTVETGNMIQIQHNNNLISMYKHNAKLLKKQGSKVRAGDAIAIVGNSGTLTSGPHLHFELWYKGMPINPEQYITF